MVDRILEFKNKTKEEIEIFQSEIINTGSPRLMFLFAYNVDGADIHLIGEELLKTNDVIYLHYYIRAFKGIDYNKYIDHMLTITNDAGRLFNVAYDTDNLPVNCIIKVVNALKTLQKDYFITKLLYNYFCVLKKTDVNLIEAYKNYLFEIGVDASALSAENIASLMEKKLNEQSNKYKADFEGFSPNCFEGRDGMVPDLIAYHITNDYNKALKHFKNPDTEVSCHFIISRTGESKQIVDLRNGAWANGTGTNPENNVYHKLSTHKLVQSRPQNVNLYTFSIEHESFDGTLTDEQYAESLRITRQIIEFMKIEYNIDFPIDREHLVGHNEIHPVLRPKCPGINFPLDKLIKDLNPQLALGDQGFLV